MSLRQSATSPIDTLGLEHLRQLVHASQAFNSTIELDVLIPRVLDMVVETCEAEAGSIWLLEGGALQCHYAVGPGAQKVMWMEVPLGAGVIGDAALNRRAELISDVSRDPRFLHQIDELTGFHTRSVIAAPLVASGELYGAIELLNARTGAADLDEEDLRFVITIADDAAAAFRNAKLFQAETRARDLRALLEVSHEITSTFDLDRVLVSIVNLAGRALRFDRCVLAVWHDEKLQVRGISGEAVIDRRATSVRELERFLTWAAQRREVVSVIDLGDSEDEIAAHVQKQFAAYLQWAAVQAFLSLPIKDSEGDLGILHLEFAQPTQLAQWEMEAGELLANQSALAIRNAQLYANVPFISWLEPLRAKKARLVGLPGPVWLAYGGIGLVAGLGLSLLPIPARVSAPTTSVRALVQQPARAQISGVIDAVHVREGQSVQAGARIATLRNEKLLRDWREAAAEREVAERAALAGDARGDAVAGVLARVRLAEAASTERVLLQEINRGTIRAPTAGVVLTPRVQERTGSYLDAGDTIAWIGDAAWAELEMLIKQEDLKRVSVGSRVSAKVSAYPERRLRGEVFALAPRAHSSATGTPLYVVRAHVDNRSGLLRPGMAAYAKIHTGWRPLAAAVFGRPWRWVRMHLWW